MLHASSIIKEEKIDQNTKWAHKPKRIFELKTKLKLSSSINQNWKILINPSTKMKSQRNCDLQKKKCDLLSAELNINKT